LLERDLNQASPQFSDPVSHVATPEVSPADADRLPRVVIHFEVKPGPPLSLKVGAHCELNVHSERVWLTRVGYPYDYWLQPDHSIRLQRGERIWVSADGNVAAHLSMTSYPRKRRGLLLRWLGCLSAP
jgi:hypothetical protein